MPQVKVVALGRVCDVTLAEGATVADAAREANVEGNLTCRYQGRDIAPDDRGNHRVTDGDTLVFTAPALKHG